MKTFKTLAVGLAVVALMSATSARATIVAIGDPVEIGSWTSQFQESGVGTYNIIEAYVTFGSPQKFESLGFSGFSYGSWTLSVDTPDHIKATGNTVNDLTFYMKFDGSSGSPLTFEFFSWNGATRTDWTTVYYMQPTKGTTPDPYSSAWRYDIHTASEIYAPVPEPTTMIAGALLLLPFGVSTVRMLRKR